MSKRKFSHRPYSLMRTIRILSILAIPILVINILISIVAITNVKEQNIESIESSVSIYQESFAAKCTSIEHFIRWSIVNDIVTDTIENATNVYETSTALGTFRTRVSDNQYTTGPEYQYFMYLKDQDLFFNASALKISYADYLEMKSFMLNKVSDGSALLDNSAWKSVEINGKTYLYYMIDYYNRVFATFVDINDVIAPLQELWLGKNGGLLVKDNDGNTIYGLEKNVESIRFSELQFPLAGTRAKLPISITFYIDNFSNYGSLLLSQLVVVLSTLILTCILAIYVYYLYRRVIQPIHKFSDNLSNINEQEDIIDLQSSNVKELEQTSIQFKNLLREIKKLKINIYEQELEKKRFEINFLQNQIRPHFYLNCLTTISSMAQLGRYKDIESMVLFTSRYLRYLFQTNKEAVQLSFELSHIQAYLDIQSLRYGSVFQYECNINPDYEDALIPPLLLITFVENSVKHNNISDIPLLIQIQVTKQSIDNKEFLVIDITDSGKGFSDEVLQKFITGESLSNDIESHVGLSNNRQRLNLLYGKQYELTFSNNPNGGAHIHLSIPYRVTKKGGVYESLNC